MPSQTITVLLRSIFTKRFNNFGFDVFNMLTGLDAADVVFCVSYSSPSPSLIPSWYPLFHFTLTFISAGPDRAYQ